MWSEDDGELSSVILEVDYGYVVLTGVTRAHDIGRWTEIGDSTPRLDSLQGMDTVQASVMDASKRANTAALQVSDEVKRWLSGTHVCWTASDIHD